jgi:Tol biopolymer transport system component
MPGGGFFPITVRSFRNRYITVLLLVFFPFTFFAQRGSISLNPRKLSKAEQKMVEDAHNLYEEGNYLLALPYYQKLLEAHPKELFFKYKLAACYLYKSDENEKALEYFQTILKEKPKSPDINYFLGRAYHLNYRFDEAIEQFRIYTKTNPPADRKKETQRLIKNCENGKKLVAAPVEAKITNIGEPVNTGASEYVPVISSDQSVMVFTYRGEESMGGQQGEEGYFEDVFYTEKTDGEWVKPVNLGENINSYGHDAAIALSPDGQILFIYKASNKGDIYVSKLEGKSWSAPVPIKGDVNSNSWEGSISLSADGRTVYFSSERPGGLGGKDLYKAELMPNGSWGKVRSLGPTINTKFDDDAPFIHPDGKTLYFSSKGHNSMGGYDIFRTELNGEAWTVPANAGYPVNTPGDDIYFVLAANGTTGYYSSGKSGGSGQQDIYTVEIPAATTSLLLVKGIVTLDDKPIESIVKVMVQGTDTAYIENTSNAASGKYLLTLPGGKNYKITYALEGYEAQSQEVNADQLTGYLEKDIDIKFYSSGFAVTKLKANDTAKTAVTAISADTAKMDIANLKADGLIYKVQVAAYRLPDNYKFKHLLSLGKVERLNFEDGITRFTMGSFETLAEADVLKKKCIDAGVTDAFVTAIYKGKRVLLDDLPKSGIFPK